LKHSVCVSKLLNYFAFHDSYLILLAFRDFYRLIKIILNLDPETNLYVVQPVFKNNTSYPKNKMAPGFFIFKFFELGRIHFNVVFYKYTVVLLVIRKLCVYEKICKRMAFRRCCFFDVLVGLALDYIIFGIILSDLHTIIKSLSKLEKKTI